jgi:hypothetical protein
VPGDAPHDVDRQQHGKDDRAKAEERRCQPLANRQRRSRDGIQKERLERPTFALPRRRIDCDLHAAGESRQHQQQRQNAQLRRESLLRTRDLDLFDADGGGDERGHAA